MATEPDKYEFSSDEELQAYLDSLSEEEASEFLADYASSAAETAEEMEDEDITDSILSDQVSGTIQSDYESQLQDIEDKKNKLDSKPVGAKRKLEKALGKSLRGSTNMPRYHLIRIMSGHSKSYNHHSPKFEINIKNEANPSGFDEVVSLADVSSASLGLTTTVTTSTHWMELYYNTSGYTGPTGYLVNRTVRVTWLSGYTKDFHFDVSFSGVGPNQWNGTAGLTFSNQGAHWFWLRDCDTSWYAPATHWAKFWHKQTARWKAKYSRPIYKFIKTQPISNPGGHFDHSEYLVKQGDTNYPTTGWSQFDGSGWIGDTTHDNPMLTAPGKFSPDPNESGEQIVKMVASHFYSIDHFLMDDSGNSFNNIADILTQYPGQFTQSSSNSWNSQADQEVYYSSGPVLWSTADQYTAFQASGADGRIGEWHTFFMYADNLYNCGVINPNTYEVCGDPVAPEFYQTTCLDCDGNVIPASECNGTTYAIFNDMGCCTPCETFDPLIIANECSDYGGSNGLITWEVANPAYSNTPGGTIFSSGSMYTVTVTASTGASITTQAPSGGNTFTQVNCVTNTGATTADSVTCPSSSQIVGGMQVSGSGIPSGTYVSLVGETGTWNTNITAFELVDIAGNAVAATGAATVTLTFSTGFRQHFGGLQPNTPNGLGAGTYYTLSITDEAGCTIDRTFTICEYPAITGCTDSGALNYDATAAVDDGTCIKCINLPGNSTDGQLEDVGNSYTGDVYTGWAIPQDTSVNSGCVIQSDGIISVAATMMGTAAAFLETDGSQSYTFTLVGLATAGDITSSTGTVSTQTGLAVTTYGASPNATFTGLSYGHYAIKVQLVDNDEAHNLEFCYTYFFATVKAGVCTDVTATNYNTSIDASLIYAANQCCTYPQSCCILDPIQEDTSIRGTSCNPFLYTNITCDPGSTNVVGYWEFNGTQIAGSAFVLGAVSSTSTPIWLMDSGQNSLFSASGTYTVVYTASYSSAPDCNDTVAGTFTLTVCGCTDPTAANYDPLATIDDGSCWYPSWNCVNNTCVDPGNGSGTYTSLAVCQANCMPVTYGCTDPCANNYDASATIDDGSCTYKACLDQTASNYQYSCDCNAQKPSATYNDPGCCTYPCSTPNTITCPTIIDSTGSCTVPNADGDIVIAVTINTGATTWTLEFYDFTGTTLLCTDPNTYTGNTNTGLYSTNCGGGLVAGNYIARVTDNLGCTEDHLFTIGTTSLTQGCTDPGAQNYDPAAACDDGTCVYCGCMDPLANNYNPNAVCDDGSCDYTVPENPCIPPNVNDRILEITACLSEKGTEWLHKYKIGTADDCTIMNKWKLILIQYLLENKGLTCIYNCADNDSPSTSVLSTCAAVAATGGPVTGINDQGYAGSTTAASGATEITNPNLYFVQANQLFQGDVIIMPSGLVWQMTMAGSCTFGCYNPETLQGAQSGHWTQCVPANNITITNSVNYIDNFLNFANKYCRDCNITGILKGKRNT